MVKCSKCGIENKDSSEFCHNCGSKLDDSPSDNENKCSECGSILNEGATFCPKCGNKLENEDTKTLCQSCGREIPNNVAFCPDCGTKVNDNKETQSNVCSSCGSLLDEDSVFCPNCGNNIQTGKRNVNVNSPVPSSNQTFLDKINLSTVLKPTIFAIIFSIILSSIGVIIGLSWMSFIIAIILSAGFFSGLTDNDANAVVLGLFNGLVLGILENPLIGFWGGIYAAIVYEWVFGGQILLLIVLGVIFAYIGNVYFKQNIQEFSQKHLKWLLNLLN